MANGPNFSELLGAGTQAELDARFDEARSTWPGVDLSASDFAKHVKRHAASGVPAHLSDLYLACAVGQQNRIALEAFERHFMSHVGSYLVRVTVDKDLVAEVKQKLRQAVVIGETSGPKILEYSGAGALGGWLRITAVRTALNLVRGAAQTEALEPDHAPIVVLDPELSYVKAQAQHLFRDAFTRAVELLEPSERSLLRLHYVEGLTMDQLSRMFQTPRSTIARRVEAVRKDILSGTERLLTEAHRLTPSEVNSLLTGARSHLQLTMSQFLKE